MNWTKTIQHWRVRGIIYFDFKHLCKKTVQIKQNRISVSKLSWPVIVPSHNVTKSLGKVKQLGDSSSWSQVSSSLERPQWALDPSTPACWNNVVANPCVYRAPHCGKHGFKKKILTAFKLPPPTLSHKGRTWLEVQLELGADLLLFPLAAFCVADWFESSVSYTYKTHTLFVLLVALVIVASLNSWPE